MKTLIGFIILAIYIAIPIIIASLVGGLLYIISESSALTFLGVLGGGWVGIMTVSYTHLRAHET